MKTKTLMIGSALFMFIVSLGFLLIPDMLLVFMQTPQTDFIMLLMRLWGIFFLSFAVLNWMAKNAFSEGDYNHPVAAGNFFHFLAGSVLLSFFAIGEAVSAYFFMIASVYVLFAISFGLVFFKSSFALKRQ